MKQQARETGDSHLICAVARFTGLLYFAGLMPGTDVLSLYAIAWLSQAETVLVPNSVIT
jgi:hypothetical protein